MKNYPGIACAMAVLFAGGCAFFRPAYPPLPESAVPQVLAVSSFDNRSSFPGQWNLGTGMADLLLSELMASENFVLVERGNLGNVVDELDLQTSKRFRPEGKADAGRLKNARYLIRGVINDFSQTGGASLAVALRSIIFAGRGYNARVSLTLTIVDVGSGQIVDSVQAYGTARAREAFANAEYRGVAFGGDAFFKTPLGSATADAIRRGVIKLIRKMPVEYWTPMIADIAENGQIVINGGSNRGVAGGAVYEARAPGRVVTDPSTGDVLSLLPGPPVGRIRITRIEENISFAVPLGDGKFERGQLLVKPGGVRPE